MDDDKFSFDFYTTRALDTEIIQTVESAVNIVIGQWFRYPLCWRNGREAVVFSQCQ